MSKKYKIKGKKAAKKRFTVTGTGKVRRRKSGLRHLLEHRAAKSKRNNQGSFDVEKADINKIQMLIPGTVK